MADHGADQVAVQTDAVRPFLTCSICSDWLKDAHTIMECLHSFCLSCLRTEFGYEDEESGSEAADASSMDIETRGRCDSVCPRCRIPLGADPIKNAVRPDCTMQSLTNRMTRCLSAAQPPPSLPARESAEAPCKSEADDVPLIDVILDAEPGVVANAPDQPLRLYLRTSSQLRVQQLRKYLSGKMEAQPDEYDILWSGEVLGPEYTLDFIQKTRSQSRDQLRLTYSFSTKIKPVS